MRKTRLFIIAVLAVIGYALALLPASSVPAWGIGLFMAGSVICTAVQGMCVQASIGNAVTHAVRNEDGTLTYNGIPVLADSLLLISSAFLTFLAVYFASVQLYL